MNILKTTLTDIQSFISAGHNSSGPRQQDIQGPAASDLGLQGPCLPWCYTHNRMTYIFIGILIGIVLYMIYQKIQHKRKSSKSRKRRSHIYYNEYDD